MKIKLLTGMSFKDEKTGRYRTYEPGETVTVGKVLGERLVNRGQAELPGKAKPKSKKEPEPAETEPEPEPPPAA